MKHWVYIYKNEKGDLKTALTSSINDVILSRKTFVFIVYLCPFEIPFDALGHKNLLDSLSKKSVLHWIHKNREETKAWLHIYNKDYTK